jgi:tryptophan-rich sensory protein
MSLRTSSSRSSSGTRRASSPSRSLRAIKENQRFWVLGLATLVVFIALYLVARDHYADVHAWARVPNFLANPVILSLLVLVVLFFAAYATAVGAGSSNQMVRVRIVGLFLAVALVFLFVAYLVYRVHNFTAAFWLSLLLLLLTVLHYYYVMQVSRSASLAVLPLLIVEVIAVYLLWFMADESADCLAACTPLYGTVTA